MTRDTDTSKVEAAAAALSLAVTRTSVAVDHGWGPKGCPLTADELRYLARTVLETVGVIPTSEANYG